MSYDPTKSAKNVENNIALMMEELSDLVKDPGFAAGGEIVSLGLTIAKLDAELSVHARMDELVAEQNELDDLPSKVDKLLVDMAMGQGPRGLTTMTGRTDLELARQDGIRIGTLAVQQFMEPVETVLAAS